MDMLRDGEQVDIQARANERGDSRKVERRELRQDSCHITELRLN